MDIASASPERDRNTLMWNKAAMRLQDLFIRQFYQALATKKIKSRCCIVCAEFPRQDPVKVLHPKKSIADRQPNRFSDTGPLAKAQQEIRNRPGERHRRSAGDTSPDLVEPSEQP